MGATHELLVGLPAEMVTTFLTGTLPVGDDEMELIEPPHMVGWVGDLVLVRHRLLLRRRGAEREILVDVGSIGVRRATVRVTAVSRLDEVELIGVVEELRRTLMGGPRSAVRTPAALPVARPAATTALAT